MVSSAPAVETSRTSPRLLPGPPNAPERVRQSRPLAVLSTSVRSAAPFVGLIAVWWLIKIVFGLSDRVLASPASVWSEGLDIIRQGVLADYVSQSLFRLVKAALIAVVLGVPLGLLIGTSRRAALASERFIQFLLGVSGVAWLPLAIIWFGFADVTVLIVVVYTAILPIIINTVHGVRGVPAVLADAQRTLGASQLRIVRDVYLMGSLSSVMTGIRTGVGYGWRALIGSEMVVGLGGLGFLIFDSRSYGQVNRIIVGMIALGVIFIIIDRLVLGPVEALTVGRWTNERQG